MDAGHAAVEQPLHLPRGKFDARFELRRFVSTGRLEGPGELVGEPRLAQARDPTHLRIVGDGHQARHDRLGDADGGAPVPKPEEVGVVVEQLRHDHVAAGVALPLEVVKIRRGVHRLLVRLGIAGDEDAEFWELTPNQGHEFRRILQAIRQGRERRLALGRITPQRDDRRHATVAGLAEVVAEFVDGAAHAGEVAGDGQVVPRPHAFDHVERRAAGRTAGAVGAGDHRRLEGHQVFDGPPHHRLRLRRLGRKQLKGEAEAAVLVGILDRHGKASKGGKGTVARSCGLLL